MKRSRLWKSLVLVVVVLSLVNIPSSVSGQTSQQVTKHRIQTPFYHLSNVGVVVPDSATTSVPGAPLLPVKGLTVQLPVTGNWTVTFESTGDQVLPKRVNIPSMPVPNLNLNTPENWSNDPDRIPSAVPVIDQPESSIYTVNAFYPTSPVVIGEIQTQGKQRVLPIRVFPFQYNPVTDQVRYHPDIEVTVTVSSPENPEPAVVVPWSPNGQAVPQTTGKVLRIHTQQRGFYRLTYDDLATAGVAVGPGGSNPNSFAVLYKGQPVGVRLTGAEDNSFDPGDLVAFYAEPYDQGRYQNYNVYYFLEDGTGNVLPITSRSVTATFTPTVASTITQRLRVEKNIDYRSTYHRPKSDDHFFDSVLYANASTSVVTRTYNLMLDDPVTTAGDAALSWVIHGGENNTSFSPDQSVAVRLNGQELGTYQWEGSIDHAITETVPSTALQISSTVDLVAALSQLPGISYYWISPDWVELTYPALADAENNRMYIESVISAGSDVVATGFTTSGVSVYDVSNPRSPVLLSGTGSQFNGSTYSVYWTETVPNPSYYLATKTTLLTPSAIELHQPSNWRSPEHDYDYIAIVGTERSATGTTALGSELSTAVQPLLDHRIADGFLVAKVNLQDIYDEFSYGFVDPEAIRSFLTYAYNNWQRHPKYVLLVGDGHFAFRNEVVTELHNTVPPYFEDVDPWVGEVPADSRYVSVDGEDDYLPDMAVGRIPANSAADVTAVVNKILVYEDPNATPDGAWNQRAVYVADNYSDPAGNFHALSDYVRINWLPSAYTSDRIYYRMDTDHDTGAEMRTAIKDAFNEGTLFLQWFGHGSTVRWGSVSMFNLFDPPTLTVNNQMPFTMHNACWTGYFPLLANNNWQSLGETLLNVPGRGSVADYSPSGLHIGAALLTLDQGVHKAMFQDRIPRAGDVVNASKWYFFANSIGYHDIIDSMIYFGDPALKLRLPEGDLSASSLEVSHATAGPDTNIVYTATISNTSVFTVSEPLITADYPQDWVTVADANGAVDDGDSLSWVLPDLVANDQHVVTFTLTTDSMLPLGNQDLIVSADISSQMAPTTTLQVTTVAQTAPDLTGSSLNVNRPWLPPASAVTITSTLVNTGTAESPGTSLVLQLLEEIGEPTGLSTGMIYDPVGHTVSWTGTVALLAPETLTVTANISSTLTTCSAFSIAGTATDALAASTPLSASINLAVPDVNCTGNVDVADVQLVAGRWGATLGQPEYLYEYDLNGNDEIDINDIIIAAKQWN